MEFVIELLLDLVLEGSMEITKSKKVPMWLRILACLIVTAFGGGMILIGILIIISGIRKADLLLTLCGLFIVGLMAVFLIKGIRKQNERRNTDATRGPELP